MNQASHAIEEIRRAGMEAAQLVEKARAKAKEMKEQARAEGRRLVAEGARRGREAAKARHEVVVREAREAAIAVRAEGGADQGDLSRISGETIGLLVDEMLRAVLAPPSEPGK